MTKECGECSLCCKLLNISPSVFHNPDRAIDDLTPFPIFPAKPQDVWCPHCQPGSGCSVYRQRPLACVEFSCMWKIAEDLGIEFRPDQCGAIFVETLPEERKLVMVHLEADEFDRYQSGPIKLMIDALLHHYEFDVLIWAGSRRRLLTINMPRFQERLRLYGTWINTETGEIISKAS